MVYHTLSSGFNIYKYMDIYIYIYIYILYIYMYIYICIQVPGHDPGKAYNKI